MSAKILQDLAANRWSTYSCTTRLIYFGIFYLHLILCAPPSVAGLVEKRRKVLADVLREQLHPSLRLAAAATARAQPQGAGTKKDK